MPLPVICRAWDLGDGIRSATFALGLLQGFADLDLLKRLDFISTVSGERLHRRAGFRGLDEDAEGDIANVHSNYAFAAKPEQGRASPLATR